MEVFLADAFLTEAEFDTPTQVQNRERVEQQHPFGMAHQIIAWPSWLWEILAKD